MSFASFDPGFLLLVVILLERVAIMHYRYIVLCKNVERSSKACGGGADYSNNPLSGTYYLSIL